VDNLAPPAPAPFRAQYLSNSIALHWSRSPSADFLEYRLYRGLSTTFVPGPDNLVIATRDTGYVDFVQSSYSYKLTAVDVHGNQSRFIVVTPDLPVATLASLVRIDAQSDRIRLLWYSSGGSGTLATVYRRTTVTDWSALGQVLADGQGYLSYEDLSVHAGVSYGYRLGMQDGGGEVFVGESWALAQPPAFALEGARPNPARGNAVLVAFTLPGDAPGQLELIDVSGRRVASTEVGSLGAGRHTWTFGREAALPPAIYVIRLTQGGQSFTRRVAVIR
jgi:hypothetical protein